MKALFNLFFLALLGTILWFSYRYATQTPDWDFGLTAQSTAAPAPPATDAQGNPLMDCPDCQGSGSVACTAGGCQKGQIMCPGPCLKASVGKWEKLTVTGHDPDELWQVFRNSRGWQAWNQKHLGEVIVESNGNFINTGKCPVCKGRTTIDCPTCHGTGKVACTTCQGSGHIPKPAEPKT